MFLHYILIMIILQITFVHVYHLKDDIHLLTLDVSRDGPVSGFSPHMHERLPLRYGWLAAAP
jgi:hypothetical protein